MIEKLHKAISHHLKSNRIVFWYDDGGKMKETFRSYSSRGVEKAEIENNEFYLRYLMTRLMPDKKFLVYSPFPRPSDEENWLLDMNLSGFVFASDEASMFLQELDLGEEHISLVRDFLPFFRNRRERLLPLKNILIPETDTDDDIIISMIAVLSSSGRSLQEILINLFCDSLLEDNPSYMEEVRKYGLEKELWKTIQKEFLYGAEEPDLSGLLSFILQGALNFQLKRKRDALQQNLYSLVEGWRNNLNCSGKFSKLVEIKEKELNIAHELGSGLSINELLDVDIFREADRQIFSKILEGLENSYMDATTALHVIERRRETYWYKNGGENRLKAHYAALYNYLLFEDLYSRVKPVFASPGEGWKLYTSSLYQLDTYYRKFLYHYQDCGSAGKLSGLLEKLENIHTEGFMRELSDAWQKSIDSDPSLATLTVPGMTSFFDRYVAPYLDRGQYLFVIVSDGLRYEVGCELAGMIEQQNRFVAELSSMTAPVPTYTQLGMAALLPHERLEIADDGDTVMVDDIASKGLPGREKILQAFLDRRYPGKKARTLNAREFLEMPLSGQEEFAKSADIVFLYSPGIDSIGDSVKTEKTLPSAVESEMNFICDLSRKIVNLNRTHIIVTADHGYLYRYNSVQETEWVKIESGEGEIRKDHRFIFSENPVENACADIVDPDCLEWSAPFRMQIARGATLFKKPGGGTRYVHGGRMLQELCVPLLVLKKTRIDDVEFVEISVIDRIGTITTGQISIKFLQETAAGNKVQKRDITAVFVSEDGSEITNTRKMIFDSSEPEDINRSRTETFIFNRKADSCNGKTVSLKLYENKAGGVKVFYKEYTYIFRKSIQGDFDF